MIVRFRPLGPTWPYPDTSPRRSRRTFKASWADTLDLLDRELDHLGAGDVVVQADFSEADIRVDGWPRANARFPSHPGVIVSFDSAQGPLRFATDANEWWQHNLRALALGLEALRAVDRYGITRSGEQYMGWNALPASTGPATVEQAAEVIAAAAGLDGAARAEILAHAETRARAIRAALRATHPDTSGGPADRFDLVQRARRILEGSTP